MKDIFKKRVNIKPYEYPELLKFKDAIRHSYWLHTEFNITSDIQDFKTRITSEEREVLTRAMLAISQIEINVKRFWGNLYNHFPKPEIDDVGGTFAECHVKGTEILTSKGWVDFKDLNIKTDLIFQYNVKTNKYSICKAFNYVNKNYDGDIYTINKNNASFSVTPNHNFLFKKKWDLKNLVYKKAIKDLKFHSEIMLPKTGTIKGNKINLSVEDRIKIAIQADGNSKYFINSKSIKTRRGLSSNCHTYDISFKKERKILRFKKLLDESSFTFREYKTKKNYYRVELDIPKSKYDLKTFDWVKLSDIDTNWAKEFIEELSYWDGVRLENKGNYKNCLIKYYTTNKSCADVSQIIGILAGYSVNMMTYEDKRSITYNNVYIISFINSNNYKSMTDKPIISNYKGKIYCVTVPDGCIITRYNNKILISGNSEIRHKDAYSFLLENLSLNDKFETIHNIPAIIDRINYVEQFLDTHNNKKGFVLSLILFSLFIEYVSLFGQFFIIMSFNKKKNLFKGISNIVEATSKEEEIHGKFGMTLYEIVKKERPELFHKQFKLDLCVQVQKALKAEIKILNWIYEKGDLDFVPKNMVINYVADRLGKSSKFLDVDLEINIDKKLLEQTKWFDIEILSTKENDFFNKRSIDYSKKFTNITEDDLF